MNKNGRRKIIDKTLKFCSTCQSKATELLHERENPLIYSSKETPYFTRFFYFCLLVYREFTKNRCFVRSSALSYASILALVPMLALTISVTASLLKTETGEQQISFYTEKFISFIVPQLNLLGTTSSNFFSSTDSLSFEETTNRQVFSEERLDKNKVTAYINTLVNNIRGGALGVTGFITLIIIVILLLTKIEEAFNDIWKVQHPRGWNVRIPYYWGIITLGPLLIISALSIFSSDKIAVLSRLLEYIPGFSSYLIIKSIPWGIIILSFSLFYYFMPSTIVTWSAAFVGGTFTGILWQLNSTYSIIYASSVISYSKMYGFLAAIPILLFGIYLSWLLLLLGCQVSYIWQNNLTYIQQRLYETTTQRERELTGIRIMTLIGKNFEEGKQPLTNEEICKAIDIPSSLSSEILNKLLQEGILVHTDKNAFSPNLPLDKLNCAQIIAAISHGGSESSILKNVFDSDSSAPVKTYLLILESLKEKAEKITIRDIIKQS